MLPDLLFRIRAQGDTARAFAATRAEVDKTKASFGGLAGQAGMVRSLLAGFAGGLAFGAFAELRRLPAIIGDIVSESSAMAKMADRIGVTTDRLQELHHSANLADVEVSDLDRSMEQFSKRLGEAQTGTGNLARILEVNNVPLRDASGNLRSVNDLLDDYAELIRNARGDTDRMYLATEAFGRSGMGMVNVLAEGADGLRETADEAHNLGVIIDEELLRDAEQINDDWGRFTASLSTSFKSFVLEVTTGVSDVRNFLRSLPGGDQNAASLLGSKTGAAVNGLDITVPVKAPGGPPTNLPSTGDRGADRAANKIKSVVEALELERANLYRTDAEQEVYNNLKRAGVEINTAAGQQIAALTREITAERTAMEALNDAANFAGDAIFDALEGVILKGEKAADVVKRMALAFAEAALKATLLGQGPLAGIFGTSPSKSGALGGLFGSLSKLLPGFADGGSMVLGGAGGPDSNVYAFRGTPGERVTFNPPGKPGSDGGPIMITVQAAPSKYFDLEVTRISRGEARQATAAGITGAKRAESRQQRLDQ